MNKKQTLLKSQKERDYNGRFTNGNKFGIGRPKGSISIITMLKQELEKEYPETGYSFFDEKKTYLQALVSKILIMAIDNENESMIKLLINYIDGAPTNKDMVKVELEEKAQKNETS